MKKPGFRGRAFMVFAVSTLLSLTLTQTMPGIRRDNHEDNKNKEAAGFLIHFVDHLLRDS